MVLGDSSSSMMRNDNLDVNVVVLGESSSSMRMSNDSLDNDLVSRLLRGGSGGGSSGGGSSDGGYSGGGTNTNNYGNSDGDMPTWMAISLGCLFGFFSMLSCCQFYRKNKHHFNNKSIVIGKDEQFDEAVAEVRRNIVYASTSDTTSDTKFRSYTANFRISYTDGGKSLTGTLNISLENDGYSGYKVSGTGGDADGKTTITDGVVNYDGHAWWLESTIDGRDKGLKVLSEGKFDFTNNNFTGTWKSNTKCDGEYTSFVGENVKSVAASNDSPTFEEKLSVDPFTTIK